MGKYINWDDIVGRYPGINKVGGATEIGSAFIGYVENQVEGMLSTKYSVPFSDNNVTVKDLCVDLVYIKAANLAVKQRDQLRKEFMERISRLIEGSESLITSSGDVIGHVGGTVWSNTKDYHPTFGMSPEEYLSVDSNLISDEEDDRG